MDLVTYTFNFLILNLVCQSHQRWGTFIPNLGTLGLRVLELFAMYATDVTDRQTDGLPENRNQPESTGIHRNQPESTGIHRNQPLNLRNQLPKNRNQPESTGINRLGLVLEFILNCNILCMLKF